MVHERLDPPESLVNRAVVLDHLRSTRRERAREATSRMMVGSFTPNERERLVRDHNIKLGDVEGLKWAMKQDEYRHCKVAT